MKCNVVKWVLPFVVMMNLSSCYTYKPSYIHSPKFEEKGELTVELNGGNRFGANLSYNPINYFAILGEVAGGPSTVFEREAPPYYVDNNQQRISKFNYKDYFYGAAVGTYGQYSEKIYQDLYIGYGEGSSSTANNPGAVLFPKGDYDLIAYQGKYKNIFVQTSLKFAMKSTFDISLAARINYLEFNSFNYVFGEGYYDKATQYSENKVKNFFWHREKIALQLGLTMEKKLDFFTLSLQIQMGTPRNYYPDYFDVRPISMFIGAAIPINQFWEKD